MNQPTTRMTIPEIYYVMICGRKYNDAKVTLRNLNGVYHLCIHKRHFADHLSAMSYLREDARSIVGPVEVQS